ISFVTGVGSLGWKAIRDRLSPPRQPFCRFLCFKLGHKLKQFPDSWTSNGDLVLEVDSVQFCQCHFRLPLIPLRLLVRSPDDSCSGHAAFFTCKHYCTSLSANMTGASALLCTRRFSFTVRAPGQSTQSFTTPISFKLSCWFAAKRALLSTEFFAAAPN